MSGLEELNEKLDRLLTMHGDMSKVIDKLKGEIKILNESDQYKNNQEKLETNYTDEVKKNPPDTPNLSTDTLTEYIPRQRKETNERTAFSKSEIHNYQVKTSEPKIDIEKLIGENLINKIGILILIIGVAIGAKYSIENNLINPLTRIILGYIAGASLLITGIKLKDKYTNYSGVLVSGAMAIFYFITFFAYSFYDIFNQLVAFGLMAIFTIFTVIASLNYNKQVIAHIGLIGAIAVPFLLSDGSSNSVFLFGYLLVINIGIFFISLKKQWTILFYNAFGLTWLVYLFWYAFSSEISRDFIVAFGFATVFFLLFYAIFITYKVKNLVKYKIGDIIVLLFNSMIFYGVGYSLLSTSKFGSSWLGIFTVTNAFIHFGVAKLIQTKKSSDKNLFYLVIGLVLVFLTMAIPVQLDGGYVTIMWMAMAALLFWIGRTKNVPFYEYICYGLILIASFSLAQDWEAGYRIVQYGSNGFKITPIINSIFLASLISILSTGFINWMARKPEHLENSKVNPEFLKFTKMALPILFLGILYFTFFKEIQYFFDQYLEDSTKEISKSGERRLNIIRNYSISSLSNIWLMVYSIIFMSGILLFNSREANNRTIHIVVILSSLALVFTFLTGGLFDISELRKAYIDQTNTDYYHIGIYYIWIRYLSIAVFSGLCWILYKFAKKNMNTRLLKMSIDVTLASILLWLLSSELIHWLDFSESRNQYGLGLSILWGIYSASIIAFGMWKHKKHLRLLGIAIFALTIVKLFFYDLASLSTISKTIVLVALGILLLGTSFLYNKYTIDDNTDEEH